MIQSMIEKFDYKIVPPSQILLYHQGIDKSCGCVSTSCSCEWAFSFGSKS